MSLTIVFKVGTILLNRYRNFLCSLHILINAEIINRLWTKNYVRVTKIEKNTMND